MVNFNNYDLYFNWWLVWKQLWIMCAPPIAGILLLYRAFRMNTFITICIHSNLYSHCHYKSFFFSWILQLNLVFIIMSDVLPLREWTSKGFALIFINWLKNKKAGGSFLSFLSRNKFTFLFEASDIILASCNCFQSFPIESVHE